MKLTAEQFEGMALEHVDMLYRLARRLAAERTAAEDLVQETYLRAFAARDGFELKAYGIRPWLIRILRNVHLTRVQRERVRPISMHGENLNDVRSVADDPSEGATSTALSAEGSVDLRGINFEAMDERLVAAVERLPVDYQTVLLLWAIDGLTYQEIASACDVPVGTVMSRLHRARKSLIERLAGDLSPSRQQKKE